MVKNLRDLTDNPDLRPVLIEDCVKLIDGEVKSKRGLAGIAVKTGYALVKAFRPRMIQNSVDALLDEFTDVLQVYHERYQEEGAQGTLEQYLVARAPDVAEGLLQVTDARARQSRHTTIVKAYNKLRAKAKKNVEQAMPGLGRILDQHIA